MHLLVHKDYESVCRWTAKYIIDRINGFAPDLKRSFVLGLPTGSTPVGVYQKLVEAFKEGKVSFSDIITFNMDEYVGLPDDHPQSFRRFMQDNFFDHVDVRPENAHLLDGMAKDPEAECKAYEEAIKVAGGIDLFLGGIGVNGHIAFNEPGSSLNSRTRIKTLDRNTRIVNSRFFDGDMEKVPSLALTVGIGTIMDAREVIIIVSGRQKAHALQTAIEGGVNHWCPLSCLQMHNRAIIVTDEDGASEMKFGTVRYFQGIDMSEIK